MLLPQTVRQSSSYDAMFARKVRLRWYFTDLTAASQRPPKCGPCGGMNFHWHPSVVRKSWTLDICVGHCNMLLTSRSSLTAPWKFVPLYE